MNFDPKQPAEEYYVGFDFSEDLGEETISSFTVTASLDGEDATDDILDTDKNTHTDTIAYVWVQGGVHLSSYQIECRITGSAGSVYEADATLRVVER